MIGVVDLLSQTLPQSIVEIDEPSAFIGQVLSPLNGIAAIVAITALAVVFAYRRLF